MAQRAAYENSVAYRVFKSNGTKCIRKFENLVDAVDWCTVSTSGAAYRIEWKYPEESKARRMYV